MTPAVAVLLIFSTCWVWSTNGMPNTNDSTMKSVLSESTTHNVRPDLLLERSRQSYDQVNDGTGNTERIVGGVVTSIEDNPYQVSLQLGRTHFCGGSIISHDYVITAAHCVQKPWELYSVRMGSTVANKEGTVHTIDKFIVHSMYGSKSAIQDDYDIALLHLTDPISFSKTMQPVMLPAANEEVTSGTLAVVTGWGTAYFGGPAELQLRKVEVPIITNSACMKSFSGISQRMICAGYRIGGRDACQGDSGGPLVANGMLVGIVSWGNGCALPGYPGVYTRVAALRDWIRQNSGV